MRLECVPNCLSAVKTRPTYIPENGGNGEFDVKERAARVNMVRIGTAVIELVWSQLTLPDDTAARARELEASIS